MPSTHPSDVVCGVPDLFSLFENRGTITTPAIFRGELTHYPNYLCPSKFRAAAPAGKFGDYNRFFSRYAASAARDYMFDRLFPNVSPRSLPAVTLAQHYGEPIRLLDVTFYPLVALYFASLSHDTDDDFVYVYFGNFLNATATTQKRSLEVSVTSDRIGNYHPYQDTLLLYRPEWYNTRSAAQTGAFVFTKGFHQNLWCGGAAFRVRADRKAEIRRQRGRFGIVKKHLFSQHGHP